jgi:hypothetical protein
MQQRGVEYFMERMTETKAVLAALEPYVPEIRDALTRQWEISEEQMPVMRAMIESRRREAIKSERLLGVRRPPASTPPKRNSQ